MKKAITLLLLTALCLCAATSAYADHWDGQEGWTVTYTADGKMDSNFRSSEYNDPVKGLQPGDDITFTVTLKSENAKEADWYMTNEVLHSLEDSSEGLSGGAYSYELTYYGPEETRVLYTSDTVGGDSVSASGVGLHEATSALEDYFFLDTLGEGQTAQVTLNVALEGETQGNRYQDTLADLQMNFAVEAHEGSTPSKTDVVQTGDPIDLFPFYLLMLVSGIGLLVLSIVDIREQRGRRRGE